MKKLLSGLLQYKDGNEWKDIPALDGKTGDKGDTGATPNLSIGTVTELLPSESPTATLTGTTENPVLNLGIPKGATGEVTEEALAEMLVNKADVIVDTASGAIVTITDGANNLPIKSITVQIEPLQWGTGTPSSSNIRRLEGYPLVKVHKTKANLIGGTDLKDEIQYCYPGIDYNSEGEYLYKGAANISGKRILRSVYRANKQFTTMFMLYKTVGTGTNLRIIYTDGTNKNLSAMTEIEQKELSVTVSNSNKKVLEIRGVNSSGTTRIYYMESGVFLGDLSASQYEPYAGQTYTINLPQDMETVYGGSLTINEDGTGVLTVTDGYIESYNGETLPSTWISSMDVYAEGTTPTTGAQVVYKLAEPLTYNITVPQITTFLGLNNIWADTGEIFVNYRCDTKLYIDKKVASLV